MGKYDNLDRLTFCRAQASKVDSYQFDNQTNIVTGNNCNIASSVEFTQGFGYARNHDGGWEHIYHLGNVIIGDNVDIFPYATINIGTVGSTTIGNGTKIDHHCHIGHNTVIGENCVICAGAVLCGSCVIGDNVWIGVGAIIKNKIKVGDGAYIGLGAVVVKDVPPNTLAYGNPARFYERDELPHNKVG